MRTRLIGGLAAASLAAVLAAGCSDASSPPPAPGTSPASSPASAPVAFNQADVLFVQGMIPHHSQAVAMSGLAPTRAASPEVKDLATRINGAQGPEIDQMNALLAAWGQPPPGPMSMSGSMEGMASDQQMTQLAATSGPAFDRMFLEMMIAHHRGAIPQAQTEVAQGSNPEAKQLAEQIIAGQQAEITEMQALIGRV